MWRNLFAVLAVLSTATTAGAQAPPIGKQDVYGGPVCSTASDAYDIADYANAHKGDADTPWTIKRGQNLCWMADKTLAEVKSIGPMYYNARVNRWIVIVEFEKINSDGTRDHQTFMGFLPLQTALAQTQKPRLRRGFLAVLCYSVSIV
jgi:hypothetical protein